MSFDTGATHISPLALLISSTPLLSVILITFHLKLGLNRDLLIGAIRCIVQLSLVGYALGPIIRANTWYITLPYLLGMITVAALESVQRPRYGYSGMFTQVFLALGITCTALVTFASVFIIPTQPSFDSRYLIPLMGMLLGNACSSISIGLSHALSSLTTQSSTVEALLALGADRSESTTHITRASIRLSLINLINTLNVAGLVTIPGMMTGQILAGSSPALAARYQIVVFFMITTATALSATGTVYLAVHSVVTDEGVRGEKVWGKEGSKDLLLLGFRGVRGVVGGLLEGKRRTRRRGLGGLERGETIGLTLDLYERPSSPDHADHPPPTHTHLEQRTSTPASSILIAENLRTFIPGQSSRPPLSLQVQSSEIIFILGPSGCGKTRFLRALAALDPIANGRMALNTRSVGESGPVDWRAQVGYVAQGRVGWNDVPLAPTPAALFLLASHFESQRNRSHLHLNLPDLAQAMNLDPSLLEASWSSLSGGQAQRAQLAVQLALNPAILLLDEPTSALDTENRERVERVLRESGAGVVWVTHDLEQPDRVGGRVVRIKEGGAEWVA